MARRPRKKPWYTLLRSRMTIVACTSAAISKPAQSMRVMLPKSWSAREPKAVTSRRTLRKHCRASGARSFSADYLAEFTTRAPCRRGLYRRRSASGFGRLERILGIRSARRRSGYRRSWQTDRQRVSARGGDHDAGDRQFVYNGRNSSARLVKSRRLRGRSRGSGYSRRRKITAARLARRRAFHRGLKSLQARYALIGDVRGSGLFLGIDLVLDRETREAAPLQASYVVNRLRDCGILAGTDGPHHNVIKLRPPLVFSKPTQIFSSRH